jgi:hypothetical protein
MIGLGGPARPWYVTATSANEDVKDSVRITRILTYSELSCTVGKVTPRPERWYT